MKYTEKYEVLAHDTEPRGTMRTGAILKYMQETANHQLRDEKPSYYELFDMGLAFVLSRINIKIHKPLYRYDTFESSSWHCQSKGVTFQRCYELTKDGEVYAQANSAWGLVNIEDKSIKKVDEIDLDKYTKDEAYEPINKLRFKIPNDANLQLVGKKTVMYSEIDVNMHMNNRHYPYMICNYLPDVQNLFVTEMGISFLSEAPYGCELEVWRSDLCDGYYYFRTINDGKVNIEAKVKVEPFVG